jgi:predicted dienelactone hydrolase
VQPLEIGFVLIALSLLLAHNARAAEQRHRVALFAAGLVTLALAGWLDQVRWQMAPAYLLFVALGLLFLRRSYSHVAVRSLGVATGGVMLAASTVLSLGLPVLTLPSPDGPHAVGTMSLALVDESRDGSVFGAPDEKREIYLQAWYPGVIAEGQLKPRRRTLWEELHRGELDRFTVFTRYLRGVDTHSYEGIPLAAAEDTYPVIVFSHAIVSFAEQSTLLMEHLASHGYVVFAVSHTYLSMRVVGSDGEAVYPKLDAVNAASAPFDAATADHTRRVAQAGSAEERRRLQIERYAAAVELNKLMAVFVADLRFLLDALETPERYPPLQAFARRLDAERVGLLGMSFGGGAATEVCKSDARCRAGLNIDGGTFGERQAQPLQVPFLALLREDTRPHLEYLLTTSESDYYQVSVAGAEHLDFTDDAVVLPILKWLRITGSIDALRVTSITNAVARRFFDAYLRGAPKPRFDDEFPELTVETNAADGLQ